MIASRPDESVIEIFWRQHAGQEWVAVLVDRRTGRSYQVASLPELREVLQDLVPAGMVNPAVDRTNSLASEL